jgi:hypothetical protein
MKILLRLWDGLRQLIGLALPIFAKAGDFRAMGPVLRGVLAVLVVAVLLVLAWVAQRNIPGLTVGLPGLFQEYWLPVLVLIVCALVWLGWGLWRVWMVEDETSEYPDIDRAWADALSALREKEINLQEVPLFLVLGRPAAGEEHLFKAAQLPFTVKHDPPSQDVPLHVYANRQDGIFITCAGASRLGQRATLLALTAKALAETPPDELPQSPDIDPGKTIGPANFKEREVRQMAQVLVLARQGGRSPANMTIQEQEILRLLERSDKPGEAELQSARLQYLCRLIVRDRRPECPLNGILVLLPGAALHNDSDARKTSSDCQMDLRAAWEVFQMHCPLFALVCDLENEPGFPEFFHGYLDQWRTEEEKRRERKRRLGRRFGWGVGLEGGARLRMVEEQVQWIGRGMFPFQIFKNIVRVETPDGEDPAEVLRRNGRICRFLEAMRAGQKQLSEIVLQALSSKPDGPALLRGCYLAATGRDPGGEQAFVAGVFQLLFESMKYVSWTERARTDDNTYHRWARNGYIALSIFSLAVVLLVALLVYFNSRSL